METSPQTDRRRLNTAPVDVLPLLAELGRIMAIGRHKGVTHERIGCVDTVVIADGRARLQGEAHEGALELAEIASVTADFTAAMGDKAMPRLEFEDSDGEPILSIVALDGRQAFDRAFGGLPAEPVAAVAATPRPERRELADDDPGFCLLDALRQAGGTVELLLERKGFTQSWRGAIEKVSSGMGFANVMTESFHLHLRGGSVAGWRWQADAARLVALDTQARPIGLFVRGADATLAALAERGRAL